MTSRSDSVGSRTTNELDSMIRVALHERVAGAVPPPDAWERTRGRIERLDELKRAWLWKVPDLVVQAAVAVLARVDVLLPVSEMSLNQQGEWMGKRYDLMWVPILDEHRMVMRLVC